MKNIKFFTLLALLLMAGGVTMQAQGTMGTDFWVAFMPNYSDAGAPPVKLDIVVTAQQFASVTVENPRTGWIESIDVAAGEAATINIPNEVAYFQDASDCVLDNALHVTCKDSILVFASETIHFAIHYIALCPVRLYFSYTIIYLFICLDSCLTNIFRNKPRAVSFYKMTFFQ